MGRPDALRNEREGRTLLAAIRAGRVRDSGAMDSGGVRVLHAPAGQRRSVGTRTGGGMKGITEAVVVKAIKDAAHEASQKGVSVTVELIESGFFPTEKSSVKIVVTPIRKAAP